MTYCPGGTRCCRVPAIAVTPAVLPPLGGWARSRGDCHGPRPFATILASAEGGSGVARIYTRSGDGGETGLLGGGRVPKDHARVEAYGTVDELSAALGLARAACGEPHLDAGLARIQSELFALGAHLADPAGRLPPGVGPGQVDRLEREIDAMSADLAPLQRFILPGGGELGARLHLARTVARRAERRVVTLAAAETVHPDVLRYLNRLSDWLFVAARWANAREGAAEIPWEPGSG